MVARRLVILWICVLFSAAAAQASDRVVVDLSGQGWKLWLDDKAEYKQDKLFAPPVDIKSLPVNPPTGGWEILDTVDAVVAGVPGTLEEYLLPADARKRDIQGVSWWWRTISVPRAKVQARYILRFESARQRVEVYLDRKLAGYDMVGNAPFEVDITDFAQPGKSHQLAVRVTDVGGNFGWLDYIADDWGEYKFPMGHGFGGITGSVKLYALPRACIDDMFVMNKPTIRDASVQITLVNTTAKTVKGSVSLSIREKNGKGTLKPPAPRQVILKPGKNIVTIPVSAPNAKIWDIETPNLYVCTAALKSDAGTDTESRTFGFRWFAPVGQGKDAMFKLNGRRIVLRSAISWGYWPINGAYPTPELARRQVKTAKELGLNMLNFHRGMGYNSVLDAADEMGLLYYAEPGGYFVREDKQEKYSKSPFAMTLARERWLRMIKSFRSHPSMVIYNMVNEGKQPPLDAHKKDMTDAHELDPSRTITWTSGWFKPGERNAMKSHIRPFDKTIHDIGWWDEHRATGPSIYNDEFYRSPDDIRYAIDNKEEIVFWGENGAMSSIPRLELINEEMKSLPRLGWDGLVFKRWYEKTSAFLDAKGLRGLFPTVDAFTLAIAEPVYHYQGKTIEECRMTDVADGYVVNGWESEIYENHSGVVDTFRYPKGDSRIMAYYNRPLYVAVKPRGSIYNIGDTATADFWIINEKNLKGPHTLRIKVFDSAGKQVMSKSVDVKLSGGNVYGELICSEVAVPVNGAEGIYHIQASLFASNGVLKASGKGAVLGVDWRSARIEGSGAVVEKKTALRDLFSDLGAAVPLYTEGMPGLDWVVAAEEMTDQEMDNLLDRASTEKINIVAIRYADKWADRLQARGLVKFNGQFDVRTDWGGGQYFVREHPLFKGLPVGKAFDWEYQALIGFGGNGSNKQPADQKFFYRKAMDISGEELVVGCMQMHAAEREEVLVFGTAVGVVNVGEGRVVLSTLNIYDNLLSDKKPADVARKLMVNWIGGRI